MCINFQEGTVEKVRSVTHERVQQHIVEENMDVMRLVLQKRRVRVQLD